MKEDAGLDIIGPGLITADSKALIWLSYGGLGNGFGPTALLLGLTISRGGLDLEFDRKTRSSGIRDKLIGF